MQRVLQVGATHEVQKYHFWSETSCEVRWKLRAENLIQKQLSHRLSAESYFWWQAADLERCSFSCALCMQSSSCFDLALWQEDKEGKSPPPFSLSRCLYFSRLPSGCMTVLGRVDTTRRDEWESRGEESIKPIARCANSNIAHHGPAYWTRSVLETRTDLKWWKPFVNQRNAGSAAKR